MGSTGVTFALFALAALVAWPTILLTPPAAAHSAQEWKQSRVIYQLLTDRFARPDGSTSPCGDISTYCGGTWSGVQAHLDYITGLGANAIWISPIPDNTNNGYHGYWQRNMTLLNAHFGTSNDLRSLVSAAQAQDVWMMLDVVINHMGNQDNGNVNDFSPFYPFNSASHYHSYCEINDWTNMHQIQFCRLANLPDLAQENPFVLKSLQQWIVDVQNTYHFDGLRLDTVLEVPASIWSQWASVVDVYTVGEVDNGDPAVNAPFQGPLDATLNYPMYWTLRHVFQEKQSMHTIDQSLQQQRSDFDDISVLALFVDNHDNPRFLNVRNDQVALRNALAYILFAEGIPIIYYGTEQAFAGGDDPKNREPLWTSGFKTSSAMYRFIATATNTRNKLPASFFNADQQQRYVLDDFYVFTRDQVLVATTNGGSGYQTGGDVENLPFEDGSTICNIFDTSDCITVGSGGTANIQLSGEPKVYVPGNSHGASEGRATTKEYRLNLTNL